MNALRAAQRQYLGTFHTGAIAAGAVTGLIKAIHASSCRLAMLEGDLGGGGCADSPLHSGSDLVSALAVDPARCRIAVAPALGQEHVIGVARRCTWRGACDRQAHHRAVPPRRANR